MNRITATYDGKQMCLYVNGERVAQTTVSGRIDDSILSGQHRPEFRNPRSRDRFAIREARIYNRALSAEEVADADDRHADGARAGFRLSRNG